MKSSKQKVLDQIAILATTRIEDIADFDGKYYIIKDQDSILNTAVRDIKLNKRGQITNIKLHRSSSPKKISKEVVARTNFVMSIDK